MIYFVIYIEYAYYSASGGECVLYAYCLLFCRLHKPKFRSVYVFYGIATLPFSSFLVLVFIICLCLNFWFCFLYYIFVKRGLNCRILIMIALRTKEKLITWKHNQIRTGNVYLHTYIHTYIHAYIYICNQINNLYTYFIKFAIKLIRSNTYIFFL
jgi:hypothetical protein